jgi:hypothetical protein
MATVTISAEDLQFVYSQLNFLRNYVGVWSLDWQEHVLAAVPAKPAAVPVPAAVPTPVPVPAVVVAEPVPTVVVAVPAAASKAAPVTAIGSPVSKKF